jgi:hypothetical protein
MRRFLPAAGWLLVVPALALAQESSTPPPAPTQDKEVVEFNEIERGFNLSVGGGPYFLISAPKNGPFSAGQLARVELGYDIGERVSIELFLLGTSNRASSSYCGQNSTGTCLNSGDFSALIPGASARVNIVGFADSQEVKRLWIYAKAGAGYVDFQPQPLLPYSDVYLTGAVGLDYFTHLRHFSIGVELAFSYLVSSSSFGISLVPTVRYAF